MGYTTLVGSYNLERDWTRKIVFGVDNTRICALHVYHIRYITDVSSLIAILDGLPYDSIPRVNIFNESIVLIS